MNTKPTLKKQSWDDTPGVYNSAPAPASTSIVACVKHIMAPKASQYGNGEYQSVLFKEGETDHWSYYSVGDEELSALAIGKWVRLYPRAKGKGYDYDLLSETEIESLGLKDPIASPPLAATPSGYSSREARYEESLAFAGWAYRKAYDKASEVMDGVELSSEDLRTIATSLMIQAMRG